MSMIDITNKSPVYRKAIARGQLKLKSETVNLIKEGKVEKGNPFQVAKVAGVLAAKNTFLTIPLCHPIRLTNVKLEVRIVDETTIEVQSTVKTKAETGVEIEALSATSTALLTLWDMIKQYEKDEKGQYPFTVIREVKVIEKSKKVELSE